MKHYCWRMNKANLRKWRGIPYPWMAKPNIATFNSFHTDNLWVETDNVMLKFKQQKKIRIIKTF
jgi:hypothetical protein